MSQEKSDGMSPAQLVESWRRKAGLIADNPDEYSRGIESGVAACAAGLELEIKRSNYVSGKQVTEDEMYNLFSVIFDARKSNKEIISYLLSKYHIIEK